MNRPFLSIAALLAAGLLLAGTRAGCADETPKPTPPTKPEEPPKPAPPAPPAKPEEKPKPAPAPVAAPPGPPGMVWVDTRTTELRIGSTAKEVFELTKQRPDALLVILYESPAYKVTLKPYFMGAFEVTNAQYLLFLDQTAKTTYKTGSSSLSNLVEIGSFFVFNDATMADQDAEKDDTTWGQLYELNKTALQAAKPELLKGKDGKDLAPAEVKRAFHRAALPADLELTVYRRRLPEDWFMTSDRLEDPAGPDLPVRYVSFTDALAFSKWAGFHVPTEEEWEVAARGPEMRPYPWGSEWIEKSDAEGNRTVERRCNWVDVKYVNKLFDPSAMPVETLPEGKSWCGCYHMLGNVAEWTSSWFRPYPGFVEPKADPKKNVPPNPYPAYYDDFVRVIRGGSVADRERLVLRLAARNFVGEGRTAPPKPDNRFKYVGFRCASYLQPALDRFEPAVLPLLKPKKLRRTDLADDRFAGAMATRFAPAGTPVENHVFVTGASHAMLFAPVLQLYPDTERPPARSPKEILDEARGVFDDPLVLGFFSTDVAIENVEIKDPKAPQAPPPPPSEGVRRGHKKAPASEGPKTIKGKLAPGTYILGLNNGKLGVYMANLDFVAYLAVPTIEAKKYSLAKEQPPASSLVVDAEVDLVKCSFWAAIGGKGMEPNDGVKISFSLPTEAGALDKAGSWRDTQPPGK